jgi:hypothetical protein
MADYKIDVIIVPARHGTKYSCPICGYTLGPLSSRLRGWGKAQHLKKRIREHIKEKHTIMTDANGKLALRFRNKIATKGEK